MRVFIAFLFLASPAWSDITDLVKDHITPRYTTLATATQELASIASRTCNVEAIKPAYHLAYDAWISVAHISFGPVEDMNLALQMAFWPDPRDKTGKALARLVTSRDPIVDTASGFATVSAAAQGFPALERLLYESQSDPDYTCKLTQAVAQSLAEKSQNLNRAWPDFAAGLLSIEKSDRFQTEEEVLRASYTALNTSLTILHDQRLGRPLGTYEKPRPRRAEARRSARSLRHVLLVLDSLEHMTRSFSDQPLEMTLAAFSVAKKRALSLNDPSFSGASQPQQRIRIEALQQRVKDIQKAVVAEVGIPMGLTINFSSLDGD